jgi:hypothetical protein
MMLSTTTCVIGWPPGTGIALTETLIETDGAIVGED